ncbi:MAG: hypothetical protein JW819_05045 [Candidatus Krumholzibacteriota bacterium]|nr:hypothetical protein [Candidatus Krumholzibacteriota bacterium]
MTLFVAGINHLDVLGRTKLSLWLHDLSVNVEGKPAFVAIEFDKETFSVLIKQRPILLNLAKARWPTLAEETYEVLARSIAYEGDSHIPFFPRAPIIWLDEDREVTDPSKIHEYAKRRQEYYEPRAPACESASFLESLSRAAWNDDSTTNEERRARDPVFAQRIISASKAQHADSWAIAIVGYNHASDEKGRMIDLLEIAGIRCDIWQMSA